MEKEKIQRFFMFGESNWPTPSEQIPALKRFLYFPLKELFEFVRKN